MFNMVPVVILGYYKRIADPLKPKSSGDHFDSQTKFESWEDAGRSENRSRKPKAYADSTIKKIKTILLIHKFLNLNMKPHSPATPSSSP